MIAMMAYLGWILIVLVTMGRLFQALDNNARPAQLQPVKVRARK